MEEIIYRKIEKQDVGTLAKMRIAQLKDEGAVPAIDLEPHLLDYYERHMENETFVGWLAAAGQTVIATSGMSFVEKPPYYSNPSGKIGLLNSVYTVKEYRRLGIARVLLRKVVEEARQYGCGTIHLTASDMGVDLYTDFGFQKNGNFMQYIITQ